MKSISRFLLDNTARTLTIEFNSDERSFDESVNFTYEFLRVCPVERSPKKASSVVSHKKNVLLLAIESVGKHGYRLIFDDKFDTILSVNDFITYGEQLDALWNEYLQELKKSGHTREATFDIKQL